MVQNSRFLFFLAVAFFAIDAQLKAELSVSSMKMEVNEVLHCVPQQLLTEMSTFIRKGLNKLLYSF